MDTDKLFKTVGGIVLGFLGYLFIGFWGAIVGVVIGIFAGPPLVKKFLNAR
jgi:hypothetical protein